MNKTDVLKKIAETIELSQKNIEDVLAAYANVVKESLISDKNEKVTLPGLGAFSVKHVAERTGIVRLGDKKGSTWTTPEHDEIRFKVSSNVKEI